MLLFYLYLQASVLLFLTFLMARKLLVRGRIIYYGIILLISIISASLGINFKGKTSLK